MATQFGGLDDLIPEVGEIQQSASREKVRAAVESPAFAAAVLEVPGLARTRFVNALRKALGYVEIPVHCCEDVTGLPPVELDGRD
jgi:hypothetical protein